jgi:dienelactone hydrolase
MGKLNSGGNAAATNSDITGILGPNARYRREIHKNAEHGYALPDRHVYDKAAANCDWERIFAMFQRRIPRHS